MAPTLAVSKPKMKALSIEQKIETWTRIYAQPGAVDIDPESVLPTRRFGIDVDSARLGIDPRPDVSIFCSMLRAFNLSASRRRGSAP